MTLAELGWNDFFANAFAPYAAEGGVPARVTLELKGYYEVTGEDGAKLGECSGKFLNTAKTTSAYPAVGDWVVISPQPGDESRVAINAVLPRRTKFSRLAAGLEPLEQVVAANIDTVFIVSGLDGNYHLHRVERYLATTWAGGAQPVILLNKADISDDTEAMVTELKIAAPNVPVHIVSAQTRRGLKALAPFLAPGQTVALLGSSGVGKSTLINRLVGDRVQFTQDVREADNKGRHTTTQRELLVAPSGAIIIDTPGMREIQPWNATGAINENFAEVVALTLRCKFTNCTHTTEPGCAVQAALNDGSLSEARWESFQRMERATAHEIRQLDRPAARQYREQIKKQTKNLRRRVHEKYGDE